MFLAAAPYFASRFQSNAWMLANYQSSILSVATVTNLVVMFLLTNLQAGASYPRRIIWALLINIIIFSILAISTIFFVDVPAGVYFVFLLTTVLASSTATGLLQNGALAFVATFAHPSYMQAIMTGHAVAGVLPSIAQIVSVLAVPEVSATDAEPVVPPPKISSTSAFMYFITATVVALLTLVAFTTLIRHQASRSSSRPSTPSQGRKIVSMPSLYRQIPFYSAAIILCFTLTMFFPVYTSQIITVRPPPTPRYLHAPIFIPLAFLVWNTGDLLGRLAAALPFSLAHRPRALFALSLARAVFLPLYALSNVAGRGAWVSSDLFYLGVVQFGFGLSNGWLASSTMMGATEAVADEEKEATGGFMGFNLVAGLTIGSLLSFAAV